VRPTLTYATAQIIRVLPREQITHFMGRLADVRWGASVGRAVVGVYCKAYDVSLSECVQKENFANFDAFFTRELEPGARPVEASERAIVCPADGRIDSMGTIDESSTFLVKGRAYRVEELVGDRDDARRYVGGAGCVVYLSPRDYHRVHAPVAGEIRVIRSMPGDYYPVNAIGLRHVKNLFVRNRRVAIAIDTPRLGRVTVVMVAAMVVGRITVTGIDERDVPIGTHEIGPLPVAKGDEIGIFHLGSTAVVLFERGGFEAWSASEGPARMGSPLALAPATDGAGGAA